ncbi:MAG: dicarboxylate/amino acid:cation symporter [Candidatus Omnitrophica bacterium]|nr:dicarboxylate/amino acid:cation symporter [Candidatus Omnitrophota bacterium]
MKSSFLKSYGFSLSLLAAMLAGSALGLTFGERVQVIKPLGDIFLNLLFTVVVPMVFFSISSAVAGMSDTRRLGKILGVMIALFVATGIISSLLMVAGVMIFHPAQGLTIQLSAGNNGDGMGVADRIVRAFTVSDFGELFSRKNMLALIVIALIVGLAASTVEKKGQAFRDWLASGNEVMMKVIGYVMLYAPIGLGAYFAYLTGVFGSELLGTYGRVVLLYYPLALFYFFAGFSVYAWLAAGSAGLRAFWQNIIPVSLTAWGTGSSVATIPVNLDAAKRIGTPEDIREVVIPIGATIHMDGSCMSAILKTAVLFSVFGMPFEGAATIAIAIGIALLSGTVMSGIPGGGFLGEMLIVTLYGLPPEALPVAAMIGTLVDPPATMVNATGDNVVSMMVARVLGGKDWLKKSV